MAAPDINIIIGIFNTYLSIRSNQWGLYDETSKKIKSPNEETAKKKAAIVTNFINAAVNCTTTQDWINYSSNLYTVECSELSEYNNRASIVKLFINAPLLEQTLKAVRAYIYSQVEEDLTTNLTIASVVFLTNLDARNKTYHEDFFSNYKDGKSTIAELLLTPENKSKLTAINEAKNPKPAAPNLEASKKEAETRSSDIDKLLRETEAAILAEKAALEKAALEKASVKQPPSYADVVKVTVTPEEKKTRRKSVNFENTSNSYEPTFFTPLPVTPKRQGRNRGYRPS